MFRKGNILRKDKSTMKTLNAYKEEQMKNPEFAKEYNSIQLELEKIREMVDKNNSQEVIQKQSKK